MGKNRLSHDFVPNLTGRCDPIVEQAIRDLYLRFYKFNPVQNVIQQVAGELKPEELTGNVNAGSAYTIVFTKDGSVEDGEESPSFTVNRLRDGYKPIIASLTADGPPDGGDLEVQFLLEGADMLTDPLVITDGNEGPVTTTGFALGDAVPVLQRIKMRVITGSQAFRVVGEIVMARTQKLAVKIK